MLASNTPSTKLTLPGFSFSATRSCKTISGLVISIWRHEVSLRIRLSTSHEQLTPVSSVRSSLMKCDCKHVGPTSNPNQYHSAARSLFPVHSTMAVPKDLADENGSTLNWPTTLTMHLKNTE